jgi:radical SAM protein with 4Fe4S-binding SPASM domain
MNLNEYPFLKSGFLFRPGPDPFIKSIKKNELFRMNEDSSEIIMKCNGQLTLKEISKELSIKHQESFEIISKTISSYLISQEFIGFSNKKIKVEDSKYWVNPDVQKPDHLSIELTNNCNFHCKHCYNDSSSKHNLYFDTKKLYSILNQFKINGVVTVELTGGEPLIHPDFKNIVLHCLNLFDEVTVLTNGYLLDKSLLDDLVKYKKKLTFQVGLHSNTPEYMDQFCGKNGAFDKAKKAIKLLTRRNFKLRVNIIATPLNSNKLFKTVKLLNTFKTNSKHEKFRVIVSLIVPMGRGEINDNYNFTEENTDFIKDMEDIKNEFGNFVFKSLEYLQDPQDFNNHYCGAGLRFFTITPKRDVKLCNMASEDLLSWGNLNNEKNISDVFASQKLNIKDIEVPNLEICDGCEHLLFCLGCLARAIYKFSEIKNNCRWGRKFRLKERNIGCKSI